MANCEEFCRMNLKSYSPNYLKFKECIFEIQMVESLLPFLVWRLGNIYRFLCPQPHTLSCHTKINCCWNFHFVRLLVRYLEMLFNVCGSQGPEILHGNWEAVGAPPIHPPVTYIGKSAQGVSHKVWKHLALELFSPICLNHGGGFFHLSYSIDCFCLLSQTGHPGEDNRSKDGWRARVRERSPAGVLLLVLSASQMIHRVPGLKT
jgi:hypothetical protein